MSSAPTSGGPSAGGGPDLPTFLLALFVFCTAGPGLVVAFKTQVVRFLLEHHLVVRASEAVLEIPSTGVGLDLRRVIVLALLLPLLVYVTRTLLRTSPQTPARSRR